MTAAQRAMATAMIYPEPEKGGRGTSRRASSALKVWSSKRRDRPYQAGRSKALDEDSRSAEWATR